MADRDMPTLCVLIAHEPGESRPATPEEQAEFWQMQEELQAKREQLRLLEQAWMNFCFRHQGVIFQAGRPWAGSITCGMA